MTLTDRVTLNFNNNLATAAAFLEAFHTTWQPGLLYKLLKLNLPVSMVKIISSFLAVRKCNVSVEDELSTFSDIQAGVPKYSVLSPVPYNLYISDAPQTPGTYLALYADDTGIYATD
jgi:hypothetical protein